MKKLGKLLLISLLSFSIFSCTKKNQSTGKNDQTLYLNMPSEPATLNPITSSDVYAQDIHSKTLATLLTRNIDTFDWEPYIAEKWETSKDGTTFTFTIREGLKFSDGSPLTMEDIKFSFDVFFGEKFSAPHRRVYFENIKEAKIVDHKTIQFIAKNKYFKNFDVVAGLEIFSKKFYEEGDAKDPKFNKTILGLGPYAMDTWDKGQKIVLKKNPNFVGNGLENFKGQYNFDRIYYRFIKEDAVRLEMLKKGDIDFSGLTPEQYATQTSGEEWKTKLSAVKAESRSAELFAYGFIGWNQKNDLFKEKNVRKAMSHLINRDLMIEKFRYGLSEKATGPFGNKNLASSSKVKPVEYNPDEALKLLKSSGWELSAEGLVNKKTKKKFEFTLMSANPDFEKYLTIIKEDMKKLGITMNIKVLEWNSFVKLLDERKYEAITLGWSGVQETDPKQIWHSSAIPEPGHNFISYKNEKLDKLIDELRVTMEREKRLPLYHKIHEIIAEDQPYSFLFNSKFILYGVQNRVKRPKDTFTYDVGTEYWSF